MLNKRKTSDSYLQLIEAECIRKLKLFLHFWHFIVTCCIKNVDPKSIVSSASVIKFKTSSMISNFGFENTNFNQSYKILSINRFRITLMYVLPIAINAPIPINTMNCCFLSPFLELSFLNFNQPFLNVTKNLVIHSVKIFVLDCKDKYRQQ